MSSNGVLGRRESGKHAQRNNDDDDDQTGKKTEQNSMKMHTPNKRNVLFPFW